MAHYLTSDGKHPDSPYGTKGESHLDGCYRIGHSGVKYGHGRSAVNRVNGYLKTLIEAIANAKLRRMQRELELRGIRLDQSDDVWIASSLRDTGRAG